MVFCNFLSVHFYRDEEEKEEERQEKQEKEKKLHSHDRKTIETLRYPEIGVRVTGSTMFFSFYDDVIDLTR